MEPQTKVFVIVLALVFLSVSLLAALIETGLTLWSKYRAARTAGGGPTVATAPDPSAVAKLLEALKGLLQALTGLPAWIAIFLAGLGLLWFATPR